MVWNFGDGVGQSIDEGYAMGIQGQKIQLEKKKMAEQAIKDKYQQIEKSVEYSWNLIANKDIPAAVKLQHYNQVIVPGENLMSGAKLPALDKWPEWGTEFAKKKTAIQEGVKDGSINQADGRRAYSALMSEYADKIPETTMSKIAQLDFPTSKVENIPGPNGTTTTRPVNEYGEPGQVLGQGTPKPANEQDPAVMRRKALDEIRQDIRTKAQLKSSTLDDVAGYFSKKFGGTPSDKEAANAQLTANIAMNAQDAGLSKDQIHKLVQGTISVDDLLGPTAPAAPAPTPPPAAAPMPVAPPAPVATPPIAAPVEKGAPAPEKLDEYKTEAEARADGYEKGDRVSIGGVSGTLN